MKLLEYVGVGVISVLLFSAVIFGSAFLLLSLSHLIGVVWTVLVALSFVGALCGIFVYLVEQP